MYDFGCQGNVSLAPVERNRFFHEKFVGTNSEISGTNYGKVNIVKKLWIFQHCGAREMYFIKYISLLI
jgi:hypothetical protein